MTVKNQYRLIPEQDDATWCIELTQGDFTGVIYKYGEVALRPDDNDEGLTVKFVYDIISIPDVLKDKVFEDSVKDEFEHLLGEILIDVVDTSLENAETAESVDEQGRVIIKRKVNFNGSDRDDNSA